MFTEHLLRTRGPSSTRDTKTDRPGHVAFCVVLTFEWGEKEMGQMNIQTDDIISDEWVLGKMIR